MPRARCRRYRDDGTPINGGCTFNGCRYVHPGEEGWGTRAPTKQPIRCQYFDENGNPSNDPCRKGSEDCLFIHPDDPKWKDAKIPKSHMQRSSMHSLSLGAVSGLSITDAARWSLPKLRTDTYGKELVEMPQRPSVPKWGVRCQYFDEKGIPLDDRCQKRSETCRFVHPDDPKWKDAEIPRSHLQRNSMYPSSTVIPRDPSPSRSGRSDFDQRSRVAKSLSTADTARLSLPKLRTETYKDEFVETPPRPSVPSEPLAPASKPNDVPASITVTNPPPASKFNSDAKLGESPTWTTVPPSDPMSPPLPPASQDGDKLGVWRRRILLLVQALALGQELRETDANLEQRKRLQSTSIISAMAPSARANLDDPLSSSQEKRKDLVDKLDLVITQLIEADVWPLPILDKPGARTEDLEECVVLAQRLDTAEAQMKKRAKMGIPVRQSAGSPSIIYEAAAMDVDDPPLRPRKRRRTSPNGSFMLPSNFSAIMERLDRVDIRATELEGETLHGERLVEKIEELLEDRMQASGLLKTNAHSNRNETTNGDFPLEQGFAVVHSTQPEPLENVIRKLDNDLDILCDELVNLANTGSLELQTVQFRAETEALKAQMTRLASSQLPLREKQDELDRQLRDVAEDLIELRLGSTSGLRFANERDKLVREVSEDVQGQVDAALGQVENTVTSQHKDIQRSVLADFEPTLRMTETIYDMMTSHFEAGQQRQSGPTA